ncbi:MAG: hypothetical protein ACRD45_20770, partial [Bryobacteraceae bacterium]
SLVPGQEEKQAKNTSSPNVSLRKDQHRKKLNSQTSPFLSRTRVYASTINGGGLDGNMSISVNARVPYVLVMSSNKQKNEH